MFRGKESSNRIELSWLVQELLKFGVLGSLQLWGGDRWVRGWLGAWGVSPCACTCTHTHTHAHVYMYRNCKWPLTWRHLCWSCLTCMCVRVHMHVHACMHRTPPTHPYPPPPPSTHPPPCQGTPHNQFKFDNTWTNQDISIPFKDLKSVKNSPPMGGCIVLDLQVGSWVGSGQITKNLKIVDSIKIIQFCLIIYDF